MHEGTFDSKIFEGGNAGLGAILPVQILERKQQWSGEEKLLFAIFESAISEWFMNFPRKNKRQQRLFNEASKYLFTNDPSWLCSADTCCLILNIDLPYIRRGLRRLEETQQQVGRYNYRYHHVGQNGNY